ncbi:penicillin acylase family protein [Blastococcus sp. VKM Ac-2987]|uniref:penicillin acylase family protein n=1 Tax=Blastococcus sp. VKM Ac-2987 TaxID=3004141 RepID=UPI0022AB8106|nr:penicillin acylase family protein [Blastococcus sp. VKM Ac-2987]MCZ2859294.1 penicillin acylase family protein [Blastococcus sp. VKM Ac-2987]
MQSGTPATERLAGLTEDVEVHRDEWGIPHLRARTSDDLFFAQGYVHAQDRLFQMDAARRRMEGRWAEWVGPAGLPADTLARRLGVPAACRRDLDVLTHETRAMLTAYAAGVNARLAGLDRLPHEYGLLEVEPEPWEPWHSIAAMRQRGYLMGSVWFKLWRAAALRAIGPDQLGLLRYDDGGTDRLCMPPGADAERWVATLETLAPAIEALAGVAAGDATGGGSNNWAVSGGRTATGRPLLAGDPHRAFEMPGMYTQAHLACDRFDAIGLTVPGVPAFPHFAHNGRVAWSVTHAFADIHDLYVEQFSADASQYRFQDGWLPTSTRSERILVAGGDPVDVPVVETHHGPVVAGDPAAGAALTLRSMQFAETDRSFDCLLPMLDAATCTELFEACRGWGLIDHNLVAADTSGGIGHLVRAVVPRRPRLNGWLPVPGWTGEYEWNGMIPWESMPRTTDPARGYIVTANNRVVADSPDADYLMTDCHPSHRARRVEERLSRLPVATAEDMRDIHGDVLSLAVPDFQRALAATDVPDGPCAELRDLIVGWNARMDAGSSAAAAYTSFRWALAGVLAERSGLLRAATDPLVVALPPGVDVRNQLWWTLPGLLRAEDTSLLGGWTWARAVVEALDRASAVVDGRSWGKQHPAAMVHPLSAVFPGVADRLDPPGAPVGGDNDTVLANGCLSATGTRAAYGAVARYVFDVGAWDDSSWVVLTGASGDPDDEHYLDQHGVWAAGELVPMRYDWTTIAAVGHLTVLRPAAAEQAAG